jgi:hypothetical protein
VSDRAQVSVGSRDVFSDGLGTLSATAVLVRTPPNAPGGPAWGLRPTRVDLLLYIRAGQARTGVDDFTLLIYGDDTSGGGHEPGLPIALPWPLSAVVPAPVFSAARPTWVQVDLSAAGWPVLTAATFYWIILAPGAPTPLGAGASGNGVVWAGLDASLLPPGTQGDPALFSGRELTSQTGPGDTRNSASQPSAARFVQYSVNWASVFFSSVRFTDWHARGSRVRYGVQLLGLQVTPSRTPSQSRECSASCSLACCSGRGLHTRGTDVTCRHHPPSHRVF